MSWFYTSFPILTTSRLTLRQISSDDTAAIFALRSNNEINQYIDRAPAKTMEDAELFINRITEGIRNDGLYYWGISITESQLLIGTICLFHFSEENNSGEIGYELSTGYQKQGIMQEAFGKIIDYAFNHIGLRQLAAVTHKDNRNSIRLLEKFHFILSGELDTENPDYITYKLNSSLNNN